VSLTDPERPQARQDPAPDDRDQVTQPVTTTTTGPMPTPPAATTAGTTPGPVLGAGRTKSPVRGASLATVGVLGGLILLAAGVIGVHDAVVASGAVQGQQWIAEWARSLGRLQPGGWLAMAAVVLLVIGLWLAYVALRPRPRAGVAVTASAGVFLRPKDVARLAADAADQVDGVLSASATGSSRTVVVRVRGTSAAVEAEVTDAVRQRLQSLSRPPRVKVVASTKVSS